MTEDEWRGLGVQQSQGWIHYMIHKPVLTSPHLGIGWQEHLLLYILPTFRKVKMVPSLGIGKERLSILVVFIGVVGHLCHGPLLLFTWTDQGWDGLKQADGEEVGEQERQTLPSDTGSGTAGRLTHKLAPRRNRSPCSKVMLRQVAEQKDNRSQSSRATCVEEKPPKAFLCWESHLTTGRAEATSPRRVDECGSTLCDGHVVEAAQGQRGVSAA
ncbi:hypothetical protein FQN60_013332 [Etheostoma spectabile]|uniref:Cyclin-dependent kinases regulatory subunit n=1 Tax=Etheostoma spectabile TaxID=54343 RepID=A0A5J5D7C4_9PERO|nr:hypothetical protein FQN60_013332 [Etheostoma spectabile]